MFQARYKGDSSGLVYAFTLQVMLTGLIHLFFEMLEDIRLQSSTNADVNHSLMGTQN